MNSDSRFRSELALVEPIANYVFWHTGRNVPIDDLRQYGRIALWRAAEAFDGSRGIEFRKFAKNKIHQAMIDGVRKETHRNGNDQKVSFIPLSMNEDECGLTDKNADPFEAAYRSHTVSTLLKSLLPRERAIILRILDGDLFADIARDLGVHESRVSQLLTGAKERMRAAVL